MILRIVHFLLALSLPFTLVLLTSCKRAKEQRADLGPEVNPDVIDQALSKALNMGSLHGLRVGEYLNYVIVRRLENSETVTVLGGTSVAIIGSKESEDQKTTKFGLEINKSYLQDDGTYRTIRSEDSITSINSPQISAAARSTAALNATMTKPQKLSTKSVREKSVGMLAQQPVKYTYHRFHEGDQVLDPPDRVRQKPDCGGLSPCRIPTHYISFDMVAWFNDQDYQKISIDFAFSAQTPYLPFGKGLDELTGLLVMDCRSTIVWVGDRNVYVRDCQQLDDFQK